MMSFKSKFAATFMATVLSVLPFAAPVSAAAPDRNDRASAPLQVNEPLDLAILVQDDLVSRVGTELGVTRDFIHGLPDGSRVMIAYVTAGSLQVRQGFTSDMEQAGKALRTPRGSVTAAPYNPYTEVVEALKKFEDSPRPKAILLISDGLDDSRGFDVSSSVDSIDLMRAISEAKKRNVTVYSFFAPSVGLTSRNRTAVLYGQSSLNRLSAETGGRAFFQGTSFVTFDSYFERLTRELNEQAAGA
jgi:hypothetical protein